MGIFSRKNKEIKRNTDEIQRPEHSTMYSQRGKTFNLSDWSITDPETISSFFGGVELISSQISNIKICVKDIETKEIVKDHPVIKALYNSKLTKFMLIKQLIHDIYINGNGIAYIKREMNGDPKEIVYCPPGTYTILYNEMNNTIGYQIPFLTGSQLLDSSNVIHLFKNSKNGRIGVGISKYANIIIPLSSAADKSALAFYDSGCNLNYILQGNRILDTEEKMEAYNEMTNAFRGGNKNGNFAVLGNDFEIKPIGISQKDAQCIETRQFNVLEICRYLNINPILLGINTGSTYNNIEQAQADLVIHTLLPLINLIEEEFNRKLIRPSQRAKYAVDFEEETIMFSDKASTANYYTSLVKNGLMSINEARAAMGYVEKPGCDDLIIPYTNINDNRVNNDGKEEKEEKNTEKEDE